MLNALLAFLFCVAVLGGAFVILPGYFSLPTDLAQRIAFAIQVDVFVLVWIVIGVRIVSRVRFYTAEDNAGSAYSVPSARIAVPRAFLQNTVEQTLIAVGAHLALATLISGSALILLPAATFLFAIGRIAFLVGYPYGASGRAFGMVVTVLPSLGGYIWSIYLVFTGLF
ncbi:MAG TPA: MAPEG family protein [Rhizomicrobium sp.]|nr:MAPEG family protein [Rhizomicrobium sp.]